MKRLLFGFTLLLLGLESHAQLKIDAQFRNRGEFRDGYNKIAAEGAKPGIHISQRSRLNFYYENEILKLKFSPQDVRVWGDDENVSFSGNNGSNASLDLYEGYVELKLKSLGWVSIGRQQLAYDNQSLLSNANWNQNGIATDGVLFKLKLSDWNLHVAGSWNSKSASPSDNLYPNNRYKSINFLWLNRKFNDNFSASLLHVASGVTQTDTTNTLYFRQTTGLYSQYKTESLTVWGDVYYQYGKNQAAKNVSAFLADAEVGYKIGAVTPAIGFGYQSGNSKAGTDLKTDNSFDYIYRSRHSYFGLIDYFTHFNNSTKQAGLIDLYASLNVNLSKTISFKNSTHYFQLAQTNPNTPTDKNLGIENDLTLQYKFNDWGALESGYMFYLPTESLKTIQGVANDKFSQFFYLQLTLTPALFKQEKTQ